MNTAQNIAANLKTHVNTSKKPYIPSDKRWILNYLEENPEPELFTFKSDETGELQWVVSFDDCHGFWLDAFPTEKERDDFVAWLKSAPKAA